MVLAGTVIATVSNATGRRGVFGQPAAKVGLQLMEANHTHPLKDQAKYAQTDADGSRPRSRYG